MALPAGMRSYSYAEDKSVFRTQGQKWLLAIGLLLLLFFPAWLTNYWLGLASLTGIVIIAMTGLNIITGYSGQISLGHVGFMAVGGYLSAILTGRYNQPFIVGFVLAMLFCGILGMLFGLLPNKGKWQWVPAGTFVLQIIVLLIINFWTGLTGGADGIAAPAPAIGFTDFNTPTGMYFLIMIVMVLAVFIANNLMKTRTGRAFTAVRDNPRAAEAMGINVTRNKMLAFFIGCAGAGAAGVLLAHWTGFITSGNFSLVDSYFFLLVLLVCGLGTMWAPVLGGILFVLVTRIIIPAILGISLQPSAQLPLWPMVFGGVLILLLTVLAFYLRGKKLVKGRS